MLRRLNDARAENESSAPSPPTAERALPLSLWVALAALAALAALHLCTIGINALGEPDEPRYAEIGREMLVLGDWVTPHLNFVKYFEKPPLMYWMTAASLGQFGVNEFAARLPALLCGFATLALVFMLAARMYGRSTALLSTIILATSFFPAMLQQVLSLDTPLTCFMTFALAAVWFGHESRGRAWYRIAYVATALGVMIKGPVSAVLVGAIAAIFLLVAGGWPALRRAFDRVGFGLALAIILPWFALVSWRNPEFMHFFVVDQHLKRYLWTQEHGQPFWFFLVLLPASWRPGACWRSPTRHLAAASSAAAVVSQPSSWSSGPCHRRLLLALEVEAADVHPAGTAAAGDPLGGFSIARWRRRTRPFSARQHLLIRLRRGGLLSGVILGFFIAHWRFPLIRPFLFAGGLCLAGVGFLARRALSATVAGRPAGLIAGFIAFMALVIHGRSLSNSYREISFTLARTMGPAIVSSITASTSRPGFYTGQRVVMVSLRASSTSAAARERRRVVLAERRASGPRWRGPGASCY